MRVSPKNLGPLVVVLLLVAPPGQAEPEAPTTSLGINLGQTALTAAAGLPFNVVWVGIPLELDVELTRRVSFVAGLHYRYENDRYGVGVYVGYHEVFATSGVRLALSERGLTGPFLSLQGGLSYAASPLPYDALSVVVQPEVGYAFSCSSPGLCASVGLGVIANLPLFERNGIAFNTLGYLAHRYIPLLDLRLAYGF